MNDQSRHVERVHAWADATSRGDVDAALALFADPFAHQGRTVTRADLRAVTLAIRAWSPDLSFAVVGVLASGDDVVVRGTYAGTHLGVLTVPIDGGLLMGVTPTGKRFAVQHIHWFRFVDGLIVAHWACRDDLGVATQLGVVPPRPVTVRSDIPTPAR